MGPAIFSRLLEYFDIEGDIIQSHVSSPRSIAYLGALFQSNCRVNEIIAFGAGARLREYNDYLDLLGITNLKIRSENFCDSLNSLCLDNVVGIFITPPNSYSGINDPIDLICSRGGDLTMLEVLTESEMSDIGKGRVAEILEEQRESLRVAMSRPEVQFILYETHSIVETENHVMVNIAVDTVNYNSFQRHMRLCKEKQRFEMQTDSNALTAEQFDNQSKIKMKNRLQTEHRHSSEYSNSVDESDNGTGLVDITQLDWKSRPVCNGNSNGHDKDIRYLKVCTMNNIN